MRPSRAIELFRVCRPAARFAQIMKTASILLLAFLALGAHAAPVNQARPGPAVPADAALISGDTSIEKGVLTIALRSTGPEFTEWTHVFIDIGDSRQSYDHKAERPAGFGLEILLEADRAYRFNGDDPSVWTWSQIADLSVERSIAGDVLTLRVPIGPLGLPLNRPVHIFAVAYTPDYAEALDTLPRGNTPWRMTVSDHAMKAAR